MTIFGQEGEAGEWYFKADLKKIGIFDYKFLSNYGIYFTWTTITLIRRSEYS